ncbi:hypothetical protein [Oceanicella sp. SM1341]|uniref:hypothetical protein n=1 Tax=Oceanicella sp. SM1341 TaxID=1548889 RepID=UPI000E50356A|nr:hypothetical protein [Oceanicella sp. SM1341]
MIGISHNFLTCPEDRRRVIAEDFRRRRTSSDRRDLLDAICMDGEASADWVAGLCRLRILDLEVHALSLEDALRRWCIAADREAA